MISIIIPTYNSKATLIQCITALKKQSYKGRYEIIIVDDCSTDSTNEAIKPLLKKYKNLRYFYHKGKNSGPASARNLGVKKSKGSIILFTDSDCIPEKDWIKYMIEPFKDLSVIGVAGAYGKNMNKKSVIARFTDYEIKQRYEKFVQEKEIDFIGTYSAGYRKNYFLQVGGFDESFRVASGEDPALSFKIADGRFGKLIFQPKARVSHYHPNTLKKLLRQKFKTGYWRVYLYRSHSKRIFRHTYTPKTFYAELSVLGLTCLLFLLTLIFWNKILFYIFLTFFIINIIWALPFSLKARKDKAVAWLAPFINLIRNFVLGWGIVFGFFKHYKDHKT